jgi:hypothetical protein
MEIHRAVSHLFPKRLFRRDGSLGTTLSNYALVVLLFIIGILLSLWGGPKPYTTTNETVP